MEVGTYQQWQKDKYQQCLCGASTLQVRANVTPTHAGMAGHVMTVETRSCVAAHQGGQETPATQVSHCFHATNQS